MLIRSYNINTIQIVLLLKIIIAEYFVRQLNSRVAVFQKKPLYVVKLIQVHLHV